MFDVPLDAWYAWLGTAAVATTVLGTAFGLPTAPPPDATAAANAVDSVAAHDPPASVEYRLAADAVMVESTGLTLRSDAGVAHAGFAFGPVVPTPPGSALAAVATGSEPSAVFADRASFERALDGERTDPPGWRGAKRLIVRRVAWGGEDATLVLVR
ncbi:DUF7283 family protein [Halorarum halobium]|uniref:DUF7283 family protein n=1 Tax=Halorarum halobium TaxID=3075121 RepID=UPI0028ACDA82|nr:hypothetical protein [Halobaculum sp. XH14]